MSVSVMPGPVARAAGSNSFAMLPGPTGSLKMQYCHAFAGVLLSVQGVLICHLPDTIGSYALHRCQLKKDDA
jgi:hypothetical protein